MKLISCYVENFGTLSEFTYDFKEGLNIIEEENGWGKTTFAAFIKAILFGLDYSRGKKITDRKLYLPWNGNRFGGYLVFEKDGTEYRIERFFARTPKDDSIKVYNTLRNTETNDLGDNPGETIWKVDRDSYEKTAFIALDDSALLNDIISSKLGNIEDQEDDMEVSSKAVKLIDDEMTRIKAKRGNSGLIGQNEMKLSDLRQELRQAKNSLFKIEETECWIKKEEEELKKINFDISKCEEEESKQVLYEKKQQYLDIINEFEKKEKNYNENKVFFKDKSLSEEELNIIEEQANKCINQIQQVNENKLSDEDEKELEALNYKFRKAIPELKDIDAYNEKTKNLSNMKTEIGKYVFSAEEKNKYEDLDNKYKDEDVDSNTIDQYLEDFYGFSKLSEEENIINDEINKIKSEKFDEKAKSSIISLKLIVGLFIALLGILTIPASIIIGIVLILLGNFLLISSLRKKRKNDDDEVLEDEIEIKRLKEKLEGIKNEKTKLSKGYLAFVERSQETSINIPSFLAKSKIEIMEYSRLKEKIEESKGKKQELEEKISELKEEIENYLKQYYDSVEENTYDKNLSELRNNLYRYQELNKMQNSYEESIKLADKLKEGLKDKLKDFYQEFTNNIGQAVQELKKKYYALKMAKNSLEEAKEKKEKFENTNDILELEKISLVDSDREEMLAETNQNKKDLKEKANETIRIITRHKKDISTLIQEADKIEDIESEIDKLEIDIKELGNEHNLLNLTKDCMLEAKENLAEKYIDDMSSNFRKYLKILNNNKTDQYHIDIKLNVTVEHGGKFHSGEQLSRGMKDLIQLCLRMALVEAVYKDVDNPILVLDDPFINLDDDRLENAMDLLKTISSEYQIIYFICHSVRNF